MGKGKRFAVNNILKSLYFVLSMMIGRNSGLIKEEAHRLGFSHCGIARAETLSEDAFRLESWLKNSFHGSMHYMENHFDKRIDPRKLVDGARSVITLIYNYFPHQVQNDSIPRISKYAYGEDYHLVIREKLLELLDRMRNEIGEVQGRGFVDSAPVLERSWAVRSGLGWIGKNGNLIIPRAGSFFFIATLITDLELDYDLPFQTDHCGSCTRCIDACPTQAILPDKTIAANQCISYFTIELKANEIRTEHTWSDWIFGCDVCQDVCPWNRFSQPHQEEKFMPRQEMLSFNLADWEALGSTNFKKLFYNSPLKRTGYARLLRNLNFIRTQYEKNQC